MRKPLTLACCVLLSLAGCSSPGHPLSLQTKLLGCAGAIAVGAGLGTLRGSIETEKGLKQGAAVGAVGCAVWLLLNNDSDEVATLRNEALRTAQPQHASWGIGAQRRSATVSATVPVATDLQLRNGRTTRALCSTVRTDVSAANASDANSELWCKDDDGNFAPAPGPVLAAR